MSESAHHKQQGRAYEQREDWRSAIESYELAIQAARRDTEEVDLSIFNRIGDLYRRIGDINKAVYHYEAAADAHMQAGYYNNAIALCNKILRSMPNRHSIYLKLGKIGAAKGFLSDARKHFLEYAERMQRANQLDEAFAALIEFADISPDPEIRLMIADQLLEHDRQDQAVEELRFGWRDLMNDGREADAQEVQRRIVKMAPDKDPEVHPPEPDESGAGLDAEGVVELPELEPFPQDDVGSDDLEESSVETEPVQIVPTSIAEGEGDDETIEDEPAAEVVSLDIVPTSLTEPEVEELEEEEFEPDEELVLEEGPSDADESPVEMEVEGLEGAWGPEENLAAADVDEPIDLESGPADDLAELDLEISPEDRVADLERRLEEEGPAPALKVELADALLERGDRAEATRQLREAIDLYQAEGDLREAGRVIDELLLLNRNDVHAYQKRVELALKQGDRPSLLDAYLELADCLDRTEAGNKASVVYSRVLELDPGNARAGAALEMVSRDEVVEPEPAAAPGDDGSTDYVDLGSLVLDEDQAPRSTRFTVSASEPQSEDEVNFTEMLDQFKSKVADAIEEEDAASHYDLGVAFKEMGLLDEAIAEFQISTRSEDYRLRAIEMLGSCFLDKGDQRIAIKVLARALQFPGYTDDDLIGIFYAMGRAYEALDDHDNALEWYERVMGCDIHFADVSERVTSLRE